MNLNLSNNRLLTSWSDSPLLPSLFQEPEAKPDYSSQTRKELDKVQSRAILLNDMLNNAKEGEKFAKGDAYDVSIMCDTLDLPAKSFLDQLF